MKSRSATTALWILAFGTGLVLVLGLARPQAASAAGTRHVVETGKDFLAGELDGLVLDAVGQLVPAPVQITTWRTEDFYVWALAEDPHGRLVAGTGDSGAIYREGKDGLEAWTQTLSLEILSLLPFDGEMLAGSSPDGVVFRIDGEGHATVALDIPQQSIWDLAPGSAKDSWLAAAGPAARVVRVTSSSPAGEELLALPATNATRLLRSGGTLWVGTQGPALVYRIDGDDDAPARLVFEAAEDEIRSLVDDGAGGVFVLSLDQATGGGGNGSGGSSRITWLPASGGSESVYTGKDRLLSMVMLPDGGLLVGEAETSRLLRFGRQGDRSVWAELDGGDPIALLVDGSGTVFVGTGNLGVVDRLGPGGSAGGTYTSQVLEMKNAEQWGKLTVDGQTKGLRFATRSGVRRTPDDTWSDWTDRRALGQRIEAPVAPFLQYRIDVPDQGAITAVRLAYAERNLPPRVSAVRVEAAGGAFAAGSMTGSPPSVSQKFDDGLAVEYSVYQDRQEAKPEESAWARGIRTVRWSAEDPNDDELRYAVDVRTSPAGDWLRIATDVQPTLFAWDTRSFEDGLYQVRVTADDGPANPRTTEREAFAVSAPVHVDNTPPQVRRLEWADREQSEVIAEVQDQSSALADVSVRADEGPWSPLRPVDGVLDGPQEQFRFPPPPPPRPDGPLRLWLRAVDAAGNVTLKELRAS